MTQCIATTLRNRSSPHLVTKSQTTFTPVRGSDYKDVPPESLGLNKGERIAVIYATGDIGSGSSANSPSGEQSIGSDTLAKAVNDAALTRRSKPSCCALTVLAVQVWRQTSSGMQWKRLIKRSRSWFR